MTNIAEILKYCPKGMKLYSPILGECTLCEINNNDKYYPIIVETFINDETASIQFTKEGLYMNDCSDSECLLFPSKDQRDWSNFRIPTKAMDIMMFRDKSAVFIIKEPSNGPVKTIVEYSKLFGLRFNTSICIDYIPASEDMKEKLFKVINENGYKWDGKNLVKKEHQFKPFDKVLVRDDVNDKWICSFYSYQSEDNYPYVTVSGIYMYCIPFEGNEHLVGTTNSPE